MPDYLSDCRLYLITPPVLPDITAFARTLETTLAAGAGTAAEVACVQLRLKDVEDETILQAAEKLMPICHKYEAILVLNDRPDLAKKAGADGVHIGQDDMSLKQAREILGEEANIGVTCHDSRHLALEAGEQGADYVAFGAFFPTNTKQVSHHAEIELLQWWAYATTLPCVAIGGITPENGQAIAKAGADFLAVLGGVWHYAEGPEAAMHAFAHILAKSE